MLKERAIKVGNPSPLIGVLCEPASFDAEKPAILLLNSGVMHRTGTCRLSVKLARRLAEAGYASVRFDYSGIGDSDTRRGALSFVDSAPLETVEIMDFLEKRRGIKSFVLYGLCSGADAAYETAKIDTRVEAICQIDPYCYRNIGWYMRHYGPRIFSLDVWARYLKKKLSTTRVFHQTIQDIDPAFVEEASYIREFPPKDELVAGLESLLSRDVNLYSIFTSGQSAILNHASQFRNSLGAIDARDLLQVDYFPEASHIITEPECQKAVVNSIVAWISNLGQKKSH